ncbi:hypothetical protein LUX33_38370 [Actinomadura madurae]|nr:hypothetical protein [Actinomadura madurae]MCP9953723.1 hypothetical protein [Actinomadura madurae]
MPDTMAFGVRTDPSASVTFQRRAESSYSMESTAAPKRMCSRTPYLSAVRSM